MARGRMIDKRVSNSKKLGRISDKGKVLWFMLYPHLDREGRIAFDDLEDLQDEILPRFFDWTLKDITASINEIADVGLIHLYSDKEKIAMEFKKFEAFQIGLRKDREAKSIIGSPKNPESSGVLQSTPALSISISRSKRKEGRKEEKKEKKKERTPSKTDKIMLNKKHFIDIWNKFAVKRKLPEIQSITGQRETHLKARISSEDFFSFDELLKVIDEQPWLLGKNDRGWRITFDWIINAANYTKIMEKNYLHLSPRRDEPGRSQKKQTPEEKKKSGLIAKKRFELEAKYRKELAETIKKKDQRALDLLQGKINAEVAAYSKEL